VTNPVKGGEGGERNELVYRLSILNHYFDYSGFAANNRSLVH